MSTLEAILDSKLVAIIRHKQPCDLLAIVHALIEGGVKTLEITLNTPGALEALSRIAGNAPADVKIGAGTILSADDVRRAVSAGARFIVTPTLQMDSISLCREMKIPILCGCATPSEMLNAHNAGAELIKLFPASHFGSDYMQAILAAMPMLKIVPTGGVSAENVQDWFRAGASAVAVGSLLVDTRMIAAADYDGIVQRTTRFIEAMKR